MGKKWPRKAKCLPEATQQKVAKSEIHQGLPLWASFLPTSPQGFLASFSCFSQNLACGVCSVNISCTVGKRKVVLKATVRRPQPCVSVCVCVHGRVGVAEDIVLKENRTDLPHATDENLQLLGRCHPQALSCHFEEMVAKATELVFT